MSLRRKPEPPSRQGDPGLRREDRERLPVETPFKGVSQPLSGASFRNLRQVRSLGNIPPPPLNPDTRTGLL